MNQHQVFDWTCEHLEQETSLDRLQARGTVRIALKQAGLTVDAVDLPQMATVLRKLMPKELATRGIHGADVVCERMASEIVAIEPSVPSRDTPESVFARLGG